MSCNLRAHLRADKMPEDETSGSVLSGSFPPGFHGLEEEFVDLKMAINNSINLLLSTGESSMTTMSAAQADVVEAQRCLKLMTVEMRGKQPALRKAMQTKINLYREELQGLTRDLERAQLMAKEVRAKSKSSQDSYERILLNTNRLKKSSQQLENSRRLVAETEEIGISVLDNLSQQRESLLSAHEKVHETRELTGDARRILQRMTRRVLTNNIILYTVICILVVSICLVFYHNFVEPISQSFSRWTS